MTWVGTGKSVLRQETLAPQSWGFGGVRVYGTALEPWGRSQWRQCWVPAPQLLEDPWSVRGQFKPSGHCLGVTTMFTISPSPSTLQPQAHKTMGDGGESGQGARGFSKPTPHSCTSPLKFRLEI